MQFSVKAMKYSNRMNTLKEVLNQSLIQKFLRVYQEQLGKKIEIRLRRIQHAQNFFPFLTRLKVNTLTEFQLKTKLVNRIKLRIFSIK